MLDARDGQEDTATELPRQPITKRTTNYLEKIFNFVSKQAGNAGEWNNN